MRATLFAALAALALSAPAAAFPEKPIRVIIPTQQGGSTDATARFLQEALQRRNLLPQPLAIVNVPGAGGNVGTRQIKDADPDGHTIGVWHTGLITAAAMGVADYDHNAFELIAATGSIPLGLAVKEGGPIKDVKHLVETAKAKPNEVRIATNIGLTVHFVPLLFEREAGMRMRFVQSGGGSRRLQFVLGDHSDVSLFSTQEFVAYAPSGLKPIVLFTEKRLPRFPDLPTARELGWDVVWSEQMLWLAPKNTPKARIDTILNALKAAMDDPELRKKFEEQMMEPVLLTGPEIKPQLDALRKRADAVAAEVKAAEQTQKQ